MNLVFVLIVIAVIVFLFSKNIRAFFYQRMKKEDPSPFSSTDYQLAQRFELNRDYDRAITAYAHLIEEFPDFEPAYISISDLLKKKKDFDGALMWLKRLYDRNRSSDTLYLICETHMAKGDITQIEEIKKEYESELKEFMPIIDCYLRFKKNNDNEAFTHLRILSDSENVKDYIRLKAKRVIGYL